MSSTQQDSFDHYLLEELPETEQFMRDLANGRTSLKSATVPASPDGRSQSKERLGPHCHGVDEFTEEESKTVVLATMAHMMTGTPLIGSVITAQCNEAKAIEMEKEKEEESDDAADSLSSWTFSEGRNNESAKAKTGKGNAKGDGKKQPSKGPGK
ncbi:hypothetical protein LTS07_001770 [Exophiala sideris]|uniref:Uncharacterized protein n=1 Tax=Exophiala sideris TaxID=1016849 RepID=A0ABR0JQS3_9EURO|nr:hypothetical protein LTS07_001770 [Exophiala sideris]KAK5044284.1 hypothetical protein LTR13_000640 [Exophiala sideris]KAK5067784.1 hypothetical protein LTR69_001773 [Exophiala sideris]KAK5183976.1 hypothetical protein LTR44_003481 [Eurotiomycetes sp. CCFEE 6388]